MGWWKLAKGKGVKCSGDPDAHSTRGLQDVMCGIKAARQGWLTRRDIIKGPPVAMAECEKARARSWDALSVL
jgi:DNA polymerase (family 10)